MLRCVGKQDQDDRTVTRVEQASALHRDAFPGAMPLCVQTRASENLTPAVCFSPRQFSTLVSNPYHHLKAQGTQKPFWENLSGAPNSAGILARTGDHDDVRVWLPGSNQMGHVAAAWW